MALQEDLTSLFVSRGSGPFLFLGSGFSRRYLGLENWRGLLERYCTNGNPFEFYLANANGSFPLAAQLIAEDFNHYWWKQEQFADIREKAKAHIRDNTSAMRVEISRYLSKLEQSQAIKAGFENELAELSSLNVDGIITTNWDLFIEQLFPDYRVYVGQQELLFSNPQEIGEIYKIHGCSTAPESLVLTLKDYERFNDRNAYLAAKLITIFVEHPVIFIGYSISDENVQSLLRSIAACIGSENIEQLRKNLIFVQPLSADENESMADTYLSIDGVQIPIVLVQTNNFLSVYAAVNATKRKIPARILRYCKEQLFELVKSTTPEKKLCVVDYDEIDQKEDVEFLVGVGVATPGTPVAMANNGSGLGQVGYAALGNADLIHDVLHDDMNYDPQQVVEHVVPRVGKNSRNVPLFKYLRSLGIDSLDAYRASGLLLDKFVVRELKEFRLAQYVAPFYRNYRHLSVPEIVAACTPENAASYIPHLPRERIDLDALRDFLVKHESKLDYQASSYASNFRKLATLYDKLRFGF